MPASGLIQSSNMESVALRTTAALTTSYVALDPVNCEGANTIIVDFALTKGSSTGFRFKVEKSNDATTYYQECEQSQSGGVTSYVLNEREYAASGSANISIEIPVTSRWIKLSVKALTSGTGTDMLITFSKANIQEK